MGVYIDQHGRNPRSVIADELAALGFGDPWDVAGHLLGELTDQDVVDLAEIRGIRLPTTDPTECQHCGGAIVPCEYAESSCLGWIHAVGIGEHVCRSAPDTIARAEPRPRA